MNDGPCYRSKTEAKWGRLFQRLSLVAEHEPMRFTLSDKTTYLPDFRITGPSLFLTWYEIKHSGSPACPKFTLFRQMVFADFPKIEAIRLDGDPWDVLMKKASMCPNCATIHPRVQSSISLLLFSNNREFEYPCQRCNYAGFCSGLGDRQIKGLICNVKPLKGNWLIDGDNLNQYRKKIIAAINSTKTSSMSSVSTDDDRPARDDAQPGRAGAWMSIPVFNRMRRGRLSNGWHKSS